jgi:hypothetical protein
MTATRFLWGLPLVVEAEALFRVEEWHVLR